MMTRMIMFAALVVGCGDRAFGSAEVDATTADVAMPASCEVAWHDVELGTDLDDQLWGLATDALGNVYAAGFEHGGASATNLERVATLVVSCSGSIPRARRAGRPRSIRAVRTRSRMSRCQLAIVGYDDTYIPSNFVESWEDGFVASFDDFAPTFLHEVPLAPPNRMTGVAIDRDGSGAMYITQNASAPPASAGMRVTKLDRAGEVVWTTQLTAIPSDVVNAVALSPTDELFVTGATTGRVARPNAGLQDAFVRVVLVGGYTEGALVAGSTGDHGNEMVIIRARL